MVKKMSLENQNINTVGPKKTGDNDALNLLISKAIEGDLQSRKDLASKISLKLRSYIYRSTLDEHLTDDILQETMLIMIDKIGSLNSPQAFWKWLFRIASNCIIDHYRQNSRRKKLISFQDILLEKAASDDSSPEARLMTRELSDTVQQAVSMLKPRQRQTISLRCFENMSFKEIGSILNISEVSARVDFHRGLERIRISLKKQGFSRASLALALTFFGKITASSDAAAASLAITESTITAAAAAESSSIAANTVAKIYCTIAINPIKIGLAAILTIAAGFYAGFYLNSRDNITSIHYNVQGLYKLENDHNQKIYNSSLSLSKSQLKSSWQYGCKGYYEQRIFFPKGPDGPMQRYMFRLGMPGEIQMCKWLQDGEANYYYESASKVIYITNDPLRMLILPSDPPAMAKFIYKQIGQDSRLQYQRGFFSRVVNSTIDNRTADYKNLKFEYQYNTLDLAGVKEKWPDDAVKIVDQRDIMHKRGWTYFDIMGHINNQPVTGFGYVPFVYNQYKDHKPQLHIEFGDYKFTDFAKGPSLAEINDKKQYFKDDTFFTCLPRPWTGFAFVDSVCRDAARFRLPFEILNESDTDATVRIFPFPGTVDYYLIFDIDRYNDIIRSIKFIHEALEVGAIYFDYHQNIPSDTKKYIITQPNENENIKVSKQKEMWLSQWLTEKQ